MAELKNTFCWSFSQSKDFVECARRHYWNRYGFWGGWESGAPTAARTAYRLKQMHNKWSLIGEAVDAAVLEVLQRRMVGAPVALDAALEKAMRRLRDAWRQHQSGVWRSDPKHCICIRELYYDEIPSEPSTGRDIWAEDVRERTEVCLQNFFVHLLPRLPEVAPGDLLPVARIDKGDPEHFFLGRIKVYAIPDWAYVQDDLAVIHDWKTGVKRTEHARQLAVYGVWAQMKHKRPAARIRLYAEYLESGDSVAIAYDDDIARTTCDAMQESVKEMSAHLVDGDIERNEPLAIDSFPKTDNLRHCRHCNYRELCNRQFAAAVDQNESA
jgi:hypothetical protein